jgi:hypothetical protein
MSELMGSQTFAAESVSIMPCENCFRFVELVDQPLLCLTCKRRKQELHS